jgi:osmotically inducible lipoprotein OsmB
MERPRDLVVSSEVSKEEIMTVLRNLAIVVPLALATAACGDTWGQRAVTGGAIGAGSGAVAGAVIPGISPVGGAVIGGLVGAGVGAATTPDRDYRRY